MYSLRHSMKSIAVFMALVMAATSLPINFAQATMVGTDQVIEQAAAADNRAQVMDFMAREDVRQELEALGVDGTEAAARVEALSDAEIAQIAARLDEMPAGQGGLGIVIGAALLVFIILLITDIACVTKVFPFTRCATR